MIKDDRILLGKAGDLDISMIPRQMNRHGLIAGASGTGKTTTLRMIAGFDIPTTGEILLNGVDISKLPPNKRPINTVFQRYALFPHMNIYEIKTVQCKIKRLL